MKYTGQHQLTVGTDGVVHSTADEAIEARNTGDKIATANHHEQR